jgi:N6-L-threonylcarbamoyladenine synthase
VILALETSCDETAAAVVDDDGTIHSNVVASQATEHAAFGGVVPEIAARRHLDLVVPTVHAALDDAGIGLADVRSIAVTAGPGLIGALLIGVSAAKGYAFALDVPLIAVDHLDGHIASLAAADDPPTGPHLVLLASGGHTLLVEVDAEAGWAVHAQTRDDAAGEAFDKGARLLGLGYPGGPRLAEAAERGRPGAVSFTVPLVRHAEPGFSFSGLKTALATHVANLGGPAAMGAEARADAAHAYQEAIVAHLVDQTRRAIARTGATRVGLAGGVAANRRLRACIAELDVEVSLAPLALCGDNAAMIGLAARRREPLESDAALRLDAYARSRHR